MFFSRVLYLNVLQLTHLSCYTLTHLYVSPPFSFFWLHFHTTSPNIFLQSFAHPLPVALSFLPAHSSSTCLVLVQCVLEEVASREAELGRLREKAHHLWEGQAAGKGFVHRVSQLSAQYLALSNLTKVILFPSCGAAEILVRLISTVFLPVKCCKVLIFVSLDCIPSFT